jgi:hypothetical protein
MPREAEDLVDEVATQRHQRPGNNQFGGNRSQPGTVPQHAIDGSKARVSFGFHNRGKDVKLSAYDRRGQDIGNADG